MYTEEEMKSNRDNLINEFRSLKYNQTHGALAKTVKIISGKEYIYYCSLGVACEVSKVGKWIPYTQDKLQYQTLRKKPSVSGMPYMVFSHFGFFDSAGYMSEVFANEGFWDKVRDSDSRVARWLLDHEVDNSDYRVGLGVLNDIFDMPFYLVAELLEEFEEFFFYPTNMKEKKMINSVREYIQGMVNDYASLPAIEFTDDEWAILDETGMPITDEEGKYVYETRDPFIYKYLIDKDRNYLGVVITLAYGSPNIVLNSYEGKIMGGFTTINDCEKELPEDVLKQINHVWGEQEFPEDLMAYEDSTLFNTYFKVIEKDIHAKV